MKQTFNLFQVYTIKEGERGGKEEGRRVKESARANVLIIFSVRAEAIVLWLRKKLFLQQLISHEMSKYVREQEGKRERETEKNAVGKADEGTREEKKRDVSSGFV